MMMKKLLLPKYVSLSDISEPIRPNYQGSIVENSSKLIAALQACMRLKYLKEDQHDEKEKNA